jgi:eukaryotic-like serine/threonine-protein kinase
MMFSMQNIQNPLLFGTVIQERYIVQALLGKGCFGAIYLVRDLSLKGNISTLFVLKEVNNLSKQEREQISSEAMLLRRLRHESLPRVYDVFNDDKHDRVYLLTEYIEGPNLAIMRLRQAEGRYSLPDAMTIMAPIVEAVTYLHSQLPPIIHQNITPTNVILPHGFAKPVLVDFGIARASHPDPTNTAVRGCSSGYGAPEQSSGKISTRTDIYGLGATFYTLLTGTVPADALDRMTQLESKQVDPLEPLNPVLPTIPTPIVEVIHRAMSLSSDDRFSTVEQFWQAMNVDPTWQKVSEPIIASSALSHPPVVLKQAVERPATVSVAKQAHAPRFRKPGALRSAAPKQPHVPHPGKLGGVLVILLILAISVGAIFWSHAMGYHSPTSATPTMALLHKATPPSKPTVAATPSLTTSANLAGSYNGTIYNVAANITTSMTLTGLQQNQKNISGYFTGLHINGPFRGTIDTPRHIQFSVTDSAGHRTLSFDGAMQPTGNLVGSYCNVGQNGQCAGEYGIWSVAPAATG